MMTYMTLDEVNHIKATWKRAKTDPILSYLLEKWNWRERPVLNIPIYTGIQDVTRFFKKPDPDAALVLHPQYYSFVREMSWLRDGTKLYRITCNGVVVENYWAQAPCKFGIKNCGGIR